MLSLLATVGGGSDATFVVLTAVVTAWLLTIFAGIPLLLDYRKRHKQEQDDWQLIKDEVIGHSAHGGMPAKPALSVTLQEVLTTLKRVESQGDQNTAAIKEIKDTTKGHGLELVDLGKRTTAQEAALRRHEQTHSGRNR